MKLEEFKASWTWRVEGSRSGVCKFGPCRRLLQRRYRCRNQWVAEAAAAQTSKAPSTGSAVDGAYKKINKAAAKPQLLTSLHLRYHTSIDEWARIASWIKKLMAPSPSLVGALGLYGCFRHPKDTESDRFLVYDDPAIKLVTPRPVCR